MYGRRKRDAAILDALNFEFLSCRMIYLKDVKAIGKCRSAKREAIKSGTDQDVLPYAPERCLLRRVLRISGADHHARERGVAQQKVIKDGVRGSKRANTRFFIHARDYPLAHAFALGQGHKPIAPRVVQKRGRGMSRMQRPHQRRHERSTAGGRLHRRALPWALLRCVSFTWSVSSGDARPSSPPLIYRPDWQCRLGKKPAASFAGRVQNIRP